VLLTRRTTIRHAGFVEARKARQAKQDGNPPYFRRMRNQHRKTHGQAYGFGRVLVVALNAVKTAMLAEQLQIVQGKAGHQYTTTERMDSPRFMRSKPSLI